MTKTNYYREIQKKVNEMFPELMKLKFGCEVNYLDSRDRLHKGRTYHGQDVYSGSPVLGSGKFDDVFVEKDCYTLIPLGQPVTLQSLLRGLHGKAIDTEGRLRYQKARRENAMYDSEYATSDLQLDLSKSIQDQDEKTLKAINDLL